ncbi:MAG: DMT family transporter [Succinivibrio sp.]
MKGLTKYYSLLVLACFLWGTTPLCGRILRNCMSPMLITGARFMLVALVLFSIVAILYGKKGFYLSKADFKILLCMAFVGIFLHNTLLFYALRYTTASNASLIESIGPSVTSIMAFFFIGERLSKTGWLGILISCFGALFIVCKGKLSVLAQFQLNIGEIAVVLCEIMWSVYVILSFRLSRHVNALSVTAWTGLFGALLCFIFGTVTSQLEVYRVTTTDVVAFLVLSLFAGIVSFGLWNYGVSKVGASKSGTFVYLIPVFGAFFGITILGEKFVFEEAIGAIIVLAGMLLSVRAKLEVVNNKNKLPKVSGKNLDCR